MKVHPKIFHSVIILSPTCRCSQVKFCRPQYDSGASQQNSTASFSQTLEVHVDKRTYSKSLEGLR